MNAAARIQQMKSDGRRVIGCFPLYPPLELFHSMGLEPVVLWGLRDSVRDLSGADRHVQGYACSVARQLTQFVLEHGEELFDGLFFYNACDTLRNLPEILQDGLEEADLAVPPMFRLHVPMVPAGQMDASWYLAGELERLIEDLASEYGDGFSDESFERSVGLYARMRALCLELERRLARGGMSFADFCATLGEAGLMDLENQISLLESAGGPDGSNPVAEAGRVVVSGILPPPPTVCEMLDSAGLKVVGNDIASMRRSYAWTPPEWDGVIDYYAQFYAEHYPCSTLLYSADRRPAALESLVEDSGARGLVFIGEKFCEYEYFELPYIADSLKEKGIPVLSIEISVDDTAGLETARTRIDAFAELLASES